MNDMQATPLANRMHIAIFGRRNFGKSSLINAITGQDIALVSNHAGTTTDPVFKNMELLPIGPVVMIDTAGLDDEGEVGELRVQRTRQVMEKTDLALLLFVPGMQKYDFEYGWYKELTSRKIPVIGVVNRIDEGDLNADELKKEFPIPFVHVSALHKKNIGYLKEAIWDNAPADYEQKTILGDLITEGETILLVMPQDIQAPKGRLILPQVQVLRDILDNGGLALTCVTPGLEKMLASMKEPPGLVITDSQVFRKVNDALPPEVRLTSFSILMARYKGDLDLMVKGAQSIEDLNPGDRILIAESCTHHALDGDIGREKIPRWLSERAGGELKTDVATGVDFPEDLSPYRLIVHCGSCMTNRRLLLSRQLRADAQEVPMSNYGVVIAYLNGILPRVLTAFDK